MMRYKEEKEAKKEAFRKYLESGGVLDALTKVLVSLYEQNDKPSSAIEFIQQKLGGPSLSEYEKLQAELSELQNKYADLLGAHQETCKELNAKCIAREQFVDHGGIGFGISLSKCLEELKNSHNVASTTETTNREAPKDEP
ncbi:hypothetical protein SADUNF_Sadunf19G0005600 [Salix dunnii]|uniref:c-Myc-binding protein homolog n=1 Tax=Salix dunnii TaxID=1413687 RepID=A0A835J0G3_9ROSI|nr:hypothetical protein SADUNF_Sadunf19G0005600 [Salix dunnii]